MQITRVIVSMLNSRRLIEIKLMIITYVADLDCSLSIILKLFPRLLHENKYKTDGNAQY